jgi:hypothetical protein
MRNMSRLHDLCIVRSLGIHVLGIFEFLVQGKVQAVFAFVSNREIWKDEVTSGMWAI